MRATGADRPWAPISSGSLSPLAGRPASARNWGPSCPSPRPRQACSGATTLLAVYAVGLGIPFLLAAGFIDKAMGVMNRLKPYMKTIERAMGVLAGGRPVWR